MLRWEEAVHVALTIVLNRPKPPAVRLRGKNLGTTLFFRTTSVSYCPPAVEKPENCTRVPIFPGGACQGSSLSRYYYASSSHESSL
jgi:hypothetical protein